MAAGVWVKAAAGNRRARDGRTLADPVRVVGQDPVFFENLGPADFAADPEYVICEALAPAKEEPTSTPSPPPERGRKKKRTTRGS